jgi:hypothetical protein
MGLHGEKFDLNNKILLSQMNLIEFSEKLIWQDLAELHSKIYFQGAIFSQKFSKMFFVEGQKVILWSQTSRIFCHQCQYSHMDTHNKEIHKNYTSVTVQ